ncbi:MAG: hypothetical protein RL036_559 [Actinomycetota bacterium]
MRLWIKSRGIGEMALCSFLVGLSTPIILSFQLTLPNLTGGPLFAQVPGTILLSLVPSILYSYLYEKSNLINLILTKRKLWLLELAAILAIVVPMILGVLVSGAFSTLNLELFRDSAFLLGLELVGLTFTAARFASLVPAAWVLVVALFGHDFQRGGFHQWAFLLEQSTTQTSWVITTTTFVLGAAFFVSQRRQKRYEISTYSR